MKTIDREARYVALTLGLLPLLIFSDVFFLGNNLYQRDLALYHFPMKHVVREVLLNGDLPLWNRYYAAGQPMAANPAYEIFYPLQLPILLPDYPFGFNFHILLHLYVAELGMYFLLKSLGLRRVSALFGSLLFVFGGCFLSLVNLLPFLFSMTWMPWIFFLVRRALEDPRPRTIAIAAVPAAMQFLICEPVTLLQTHTILAAYGCYRAFHARQKFRTLARAASVQAAVLVSAALLGAAQLLPAIDHARDSVRSRPFPWLEVSNWSMPPVRLAEFIYPNLMGTWEMNGKLYWGSVLYADKSGPFIFSIYSGIFITALAVSGLLLRRRGYGLVLALIGSSYILAIGSHTPLVKALYDAGVLPSIRYPEKFILMGVLAIVIWGAMMFDELLGGDERVARLTALLIGGSAIVALLVTLAGFLPDYVPLFERAWGLKFPSPHAAAVARVQWAIAAARGAAFAAAVIMFSRRRSVATAGILSLLIVADVAPLSTQLVHRMPRRFFDAPPIVSALPTAGKAFRIFHQAQLAQNTDVGKEFFKETRGYWIMRNGLFPLTPSTWGYPTVFDIDYDETQLLPTHDLLSVMVRALPAANARPMLLLMVMSNARYEFEFADPSAEFRRIQEEIEQIAPVRVAGIRTRGTYYLADQLVASRGLKEFSDQVMTGSWSPGTAFVARVPFQPSPGIIEHVREGQNDASVDLSCSGRCFLVASVTRHKYWRATIDGTAAPIETVNVAYQGVAIPKGRHRVDFTYRNPVLAGGVAISFVSLFVWTAAVLVKRRGVAA